MLERPQTWPRWPLLNVWADDLPMAELLAHLEQAGGVVFTVNPDHLHHLQHNMAFLRAYRTASVITVDSHYVRLGLRLLGRPVRHRITGADLVPAFCEHQRNNPYTSIFLLGAKPGVAQRAMDRINQAAGRALVVGAHGPSMNFVKNAAEVDAVVRMIEASRATVVMVGLGAPKQEIWIAANRHRLPRVRVWMGIGATIDYEAGEVRRAPEWLRRVGLEWAYRVVTEPGRYLGRYVRNSKFVWWMLKDRLGLYRNPIPLPGGPHV